MKAQKISEGDRRMILKRFCVLLPEDYIGQIETVVYKETCYVRLVMEKKLDEVDVKYLALDPSTKKRRIHFCEQDKVEMKAMIRAFRNFETYIEECFTEY